MSVGYVKMYRALADSDLWLAEPFTKGQAWADLILNANFRDRTAYISGQQIPVNRGQLAWSEVTLSKRWKWSRGKVRRFLSLLKNDDKIEQHSVQHTSIITICNYEKFQTSDTADGTPDGAIGSTPNSTPNSTPDGTQEKKGNKDKKVKNDSKGSALDLSKAPEGVSEETAKDFISHRKALKKPLTQRAFDLCMGQASKAGEYGLTPEQVIEEAMARGWQLPKPEWAAKSLGVRPNLSVVPSQDSSQVNKPHRPPMPKPDRAPLKPTGTGGDA